MEYILLKVWIRTGDKTEKNLNLIFSLYRNLVLLRATFKPVAQKYNVRIKSKLEITGGGGEGCEKSAESKKRGERGSRNIKLGMSKYFFKIVLSGQFVRIGCQDILLG